MAAAPIDELWNRGLARGRSSYRGRVARWKTKRWHIAQCAVAAAVAWLVASELLGHSVPVFAPIAAVVSLGTSYGQRLRRVVNAGDVAVDKHRNSDRVLDLANKAPIGLALVKLTSGAAVHRSRLDPAFLGDPGKQGRVAGGAVPAGSHFQGHRHVDGGDNGFENLCRQWLIAHQRRTGITISDFFRRAAKIEVDQGRAPGLIQTGGLGHNFGLTPG